MENKEFAKILRPYVEFLDVTKEDSEKTSTIKLELINNGYKLLEEMYEEEPQIDKITKTYTEQEILEIINSCTKYPDINLKPDMIRVSELNSKFMTAKLFRKAIKESGLLGTKFDEKDKNEKI